MIKDIIRTCLIIFLIMCVSGCAELSKKFIRKKNPTRESYSFYQPEEYAPKPAPERYYEHYVLWHNWHTELTRSEGNYSRDILSANESLKHLTAMRDLLQDEKAQKLDGQVKDMEVIVKNLQYYHQRLIERVSDRRTADRIERIVQDEFSLKRMKSYIKTD